MLTKIQQQLVEQHLYVVDDIIKYRITKNAHAEMDRDDLYQIGCVALCKAALYFDAGKDTKFSTYSKTVVYNALVDHCRQANRHMSRFCYLYIPDEDDEQEALSLLNLKASTPFEAFEMTKAVNRLLHEINNQTRYTTTEKNGVLSICLKWMGYTSQEIALAFSTNPANVNKWIRRASKKINENQISISLS